MRSGITLAAALTVMTTLMATSAQAEGWCGYAAREKSFIECGYSSDTECENAIGKGGMCFIDPEFALNVERTAPATLLPAITSKLAVG